MKVFGVQTFEKERFIEEDDFFDLKALGLCTERERAEVWATQYNEMFNDKTPAQVVELEVDETSISGQQKPEAALTESGSK